jgi:hypothetical protein
MRADKILFFRGDPRAIKTARTGKSYLESKLSIFFCKSG